MKVSVVVPLYNKAAYIARALDSVLAQTHRDWEIIVVDDGSTDGGPEIVKKYTDPRIRLLSQENSGPSRARNRGVAEARAEWVSFLDADDEWHETFLERTTAIAQADPSVSVVFTNLRDATTNDTFLPKAAGVQFISDYPSFQSGNRFVGIVTSATLIKKQALIDAGGFPEGVRFGEDLDTWVRLGWTVEKMAFLAEPLAVYHSDATVGHRQCAQRGHFMSSLDVFFATYSEWNRQGRIPPRLAKSSRHLVRMAYFCMAYQLTDAGDNAKARKVLRTECPMRACGWRRWWRYYLRTWTPAWLRKALRWIRGLRTQ